MTLDILQATFFGFVGLFFAVYTVLDGFDFGVGILFPFVGRSQQGKQALMRSLAPLWDGNEVWLIGGVTALTAAFPAVYATVFSGFYLVIIFTVLALILRAVTFEFWSPFGTYRPFWDLTFVVGSLLPPLLLGIGLGNAIQGVPLDAGGEYAGDFLTLFRPFPVMVGIFGVLIVAMQGASYAVMKTTGNVQERARKALRLLRFAFPALLAILAVLTYVYVPGAFARPVAWVGIALAVAFWAAMLVPRLASDDRITFFASSAMTGSLWTVAGAVLFPNLVTASNDAVNSLTIYNASGPEVTMWTMLVVTVVGLPFIIAYTVYVYRVFKGKVTTGLATLKAG